jgi:hypothetical protein
VIVASIRERASERKRKGQKLDMRKLGEVQVTRNRGKLKSHTRLQLGEIRTLIAFGGKKIANQNITAKQGLGRYKRKAA